MLRRAEAGDGAFLADLYRAVHWDSFGGMGWDDGARSAFLGQQYAFQQRGHRTGFPEAERNIVVADGAPIGRLDIDRHAGGCYIVDIALLPRWCGQGIGTALIREVQASAGAGEVSLQVLMTNPARRLYGRLGFRETGTALPYVTMRWRAGPAS